MSNLTADAIRRALLADLASQLDIPPELLETAETVPMPAGVEDDAVRNLLVPLRHLVTDAELSLIPEDDRDRLYVTYDVSGSVRDES